MFYVKNCIDGFVQDCGHYIVFSNGVITVLAQVIDML